MAMNFSAGDVLEHVELNNVLLAAKGWGVIDDPDTTSLSVSERATPVMGVTVEEGHCLIDDTEYGEAASVDLTIEAAHATLHRKDLITYDPTTGNPVVTKGINHAGGTGDPIYPPNIPAGDILLAIVEVDAAVTTIADADIMDCRAFVTGFIYTAEPSDTLRLSSDASVNMTSTSYAEAKTLTIPEGIVGGAIMVYFDMQQVNDFTDIRLCNNGKPMIQHTYLNINSSMEFECIVAGVAGGNVISLEVKVDSGTTVIRYYRIYCDYAKTKLRTTDPTWS